MEIKEHSKNRKVKLSISIFVVLLFLVNNTIAQVLNGVSPFTAATAFLEPDGRREIIKISSNEFVVLSKIKGGLTGESDYSLEKYDVSLKSFFKTPIKILGNEDIKNLLFNGKEIVLLLVNRNTDVGESKLMAYGYDPTTGAKMWDKTLMQQKVEEYKPVRGRGDVEESFEDAVTSGLSKNFIVPFQYQYQITFSPDSSLMMAYIYDYSKPGMIANAVIFDKSFNQVNDGMVPIDNNFINYGIFINNKGETYILNVDRLGRIVVIQYNLETRDNKLLDIQYASTQREGLKFHIHKDNEVFVGCLNTKGGKMMGVMYAKFNFADNLVEKINFHDFSNGLIQTAEAARSGKFRTPESWENFEIVNFNVNPFEKVFMLLEKRELSAVDYLYKSESVVTPDHWQERTAKVIVESLVMVSFNASDEVMWENYYAKSQSADLTSGMTSSSVVSNVSDEKIQVVYASSDNAAGSFNIYNYVEWDAQTGNKNKELKLQNDEGLALVRNYSVWMDNGIVLTGKKGLLGKKYMISAYKLSSE